MNVEIHTSISKTWTLSSGSVTLHKIVFGRLLHLRCSFAFLASLWTTQLHAYVKYFSLCVHRGNVQSGADPIRCRRQHFILITAKTLKLWLISMLLCQKRLRGRYMYRYFVSHDNIKGMLTRPALSRLRPPNQGQTSLRPRSRPGPQTKAKPKAKSKTTVAKTKLIIRQNRNRYIHKTYQMLRQ